MLSFIAHRITRFLDIIVFVQLVGLGMALKKFWSVETLKKKIAKSKVEVHAGLYIFSKTLSLQDYRNQTTKMFSV